MRQLSFLQELDDAEFARVVAIQQAGFSASNSRLADIQMHQAQNIIAQRGHRGQERNARVGRGKTSQGNGEARTL